MKRPFWMHQLVEYILGGALVAAGLQSPEPLVPAVLGGLVMLHAAITRGSLAAFRVIDRRLHRVIDPFIIGLGLFAAVQPWVSVDNGTRIIIVGIMAVHLVVWVGTSFAEKSKTPKGQAGPSSADGASADRSTSIGQSAGRFVGSGVNAFRSAKAKRSSD